MTLRERDTWKQMIMQVQDLRLGRNVGCFYRELTTARGSEANSGSEGIILATGPLVWSTKGLSVKQPAAHLMPTGNGRWKLHGFSGCIIPSAPFRGGPGRSQKKKRLPDDSVQIREISPDWGTAKESVAMAGLRSPYPAWARHCQWPRTFRFQKTRDTGQALTGLSHWGFRVNV